MITKLMYDKYDRFHLNGTLKTDYVDFETQQINMEKFFPFMIKLLLSVKNTIYKNLADDNKILGDERVEVINAIDKFLTLLMAFAFATSNDPYHYMDKYEESFEINASLNKMQYISATGKLVNISTRDISDFTPWVEDKLVGTFKNMISLFNNPANKMNMRKELIKLLFHVFVLRYKLEFI